MRCSWRVVMSLSRSCAHSSKGANLSARASWSRGGRSRQEPNSDNTTRDLPMPQTPAVEPTSQSEALVAEIRREFPRFRIVLKRESFLSRVIDILLKLLTLGAQREFLTRYHTVIG